MDTSSTQNKNARHKGLTVRKGILCLVAVAFSVVSGCAVGPDFNKPEPPENASYTANGLPSKTVQAKAVNGQAQVFKRVDQVRSDWYHLFHSRALNRLIQKALANNPSIQAGRQRIKAAKENLEAAKGGLYPQVDAGLGYSREHVSGTQFGIDDPLFTNVFNLYQGQIKIGRAHV